jgi:hypothetical protein
LVLSALWSRTGAFEVTTEDGRSVFSRLGAGHHPRGADVVDRIRRMLPVGEAAGGFGGCS